VSSFVPWAGGDCPVPPDTLVTAVLRNGMVVFGKPVLASQLNWSAGSEEYNIVNYRVESSGEGKKFDTGKLPYDLLAPEYLEGTADILAFGAGKYGARNWEAGMAWSRPFAALMRHMWAWWRGEHLDAETGKSHLWHASCCLMFLVAYEARKTGKDDRPQN